MAMELAAELNLLDPGSTRLYRDSFNDLVLEIAGGEPVVGIRVVRCFPLTAGDRFIALRDRDNSEVGIVEDLAALDDESSAVLAAELERAYFRPEITAVHAISEQYHVPAWQVDTNRGPRRFEIRSSRRDIRVMPHCRILIRDADGNQYEIPDYRRLDQASRVLVENQV